MARDLDSEGYDQLVILRGIAREMSMIKLSTLVRLLTFGHPTVHLNAEVTLDAEAEAAPAAAAQMQYAVAAQMRYAVAAASSSSPSVQLENLAGRKL